MMKNIFLIILCLLSMVAKSQRFPSGFPTQFNTGWNKWGYTQSDSGLIVANRDTNWLPKYSGTVVFKPSNRKLYYFDSTLLRWFTLETDTTSLSNRINSKINIGDSASMLLPYLRKVDTTAKWITHVFRKTASDSVFYVKGGVSTFAYKDSIGSGGSGTVTSVALSMPSAFSVSGSPITINGTLSVSGAGTALQYIRGNGTLATFDTTAIPSFSAKVRSLFSGTSPIVYSNGAISVLDATTVQKGAASFSASNFTVSSGAVSLADVVTAGSCTGCNLNINAKGQITSYADGSGGGSGSIDTAINVGSGVGVFKSKVDDSLTFKSFIGGFGINYTSNTNDITSVIDTTEIPTIYDLQSLDTVYAPLASVDTTLKFVPLIIGLGESNPAGVIDNAGLSGAELAAFPRIQMLNNHIFQFQPLQIGANNNINVNSPLTMHGMELQLMKSIQQDSAFLWDTVYFVKIARAAATISVLIDSLPTAFRRLDSAVKHIRSLGYYPQIYGFGSQGINDAAADSATWLKNTEYYLSELRKRYGYFPVYYTELIGAGVTRNNTIAKLPYWDGFVYHVPTAGLSTQDANHWDSSGLAEITKRMLRLSYDSVQERDLYIQTQANKIKRGYASLTLLNTDSDIDIGGKTTFGGNVTWDVDNTAITMAGGFIGIIKPSGDPGFFGLASGQPIRFRRSNQASAISASDTYTTVFEVDASNNVDLAGGMTIGGNFTWDADNTGITAAGGHIGMIKKSGGAGFMAYASGQSFAIKQSNQTSGITAAGTYTDYMSLNASGNLIVNNLATGLTPPSTSGTTKLVICDENGLISNTSSPIPISGTYTPTLTNVTNVSASTAYQCQYMRVGNVVTVSGKVDIDPTSTGSTLLGVSLPITSTVPNDFNVGGTGVSGAAAELQGAIRADTTNDRAELTITLSATASTANNSWFFIFTYLIE